ncbi:Uncharacterised protein [uncultured archaeon]|nr:Uncharacterised protein [uncultured archaeon]
MDRIHYESLVIYLKKTILFMAALCCAALCFGAVAADNAATSGTTVLSQDSGKNVSLMKMTLFRSIDEFGIYGLGVGEAVKFTAPKSDWKLKSVEILAWSGFNNSTQSFPADKNFLLEIRDKDLNVLYKFADAQNNYFLSPTAPVYGTIEIPALIISGDFYVIFYDRGSAYVVMENGNGTGNSYLFSNGLMDPAERIIGTTNETVKVNWMIKAVGN